MINLMNNLMSWNERQLFTQRASLQMLKTVEHTRKGVRACLCVLGPWQRQISQLDHGRLWVTRESSFHLPDQQFCETTLQDVIIIISSPHLHCFHAGWGTFRKGTGVGHVAFRHCPGFIYSKIQDDCDLPFFNIHHPDDLVRRFAFASCTPDGTPSCVWHSGNDRERAVTIPVRRYGFAHSRAFIYRRFHSSLYADLVLARRWSFVVLWP